jgi:hypothetical protein
VDALSVAAFDDAEPLTAAVAVFVDELADVLEPVGEEDESMLAVGVAVAVAVVVGVLVGVVVGVDDADPDADVVGEPELLLGVDDVAGAEGLVDKPADGVVAAADPVLDAVAGFDVVVTGC